MELLINGLQRFAITKDENNFEKTINDLTINFSNVFDFNPDREWENLKKNYSNIKYISEMLNCYDYELNQNFYKLISKILNCIDLEIQYYIKNIDLPDNVKENFDNALNVSDIIKKIEYIVKGYTIIINIVEEIREEKVNNVIDKDLEKSFKLFKKRKI